MEISKETKVTRVLDAIAAGTSDQNGTVIDMQNFDSVAFIVMFGAIVAGAVTSIKAQQGTQVGGGDMADLLGTAITVADSDDTSMAILEIKRPRERYVRVVVDRGTQNATIDGAIAIQSGPRVKPTTHDATTVLGSELHASPAEGTA